MSRLISDVAVVNEMPPVGVHVCECVKYEAGESKSQHTPLIKLSWSNQDYSFTDDVYITPKTVSRLAIIAQRICAFPKETGLPDDDMDCANFLATYIEQNIVGRSARVTVAEEKHRPEDVGKEPRRKVTFGGYAEYVKPSAPEVQDSSNECPLDQRQPPDDLPLG